MSIFNIRYISIHLKSFHLLHVYLSKKEIASLDHVEALADFAMAMKATLEDMNRHSFNNFQLKIGWYLFLNSSFL